eukprot:CAMPEP_0203879684 /NCGR_PEP_ID=MMETSP0359-20131031/24117_1 /ASSEMBLY_ACC=CAM_ASM_000338 /TAXON_ID=268821 /ORGANISM="Scrippsiella Hangoei, Strain SHTV-5" /LENGTH=246 /DNA_ID=CAMNT_0050799149 /DNA_START=44 /DNA_END=784 /DNA_ORIENTATION=+
MSASPLSRVLLLAVALGLLLGTSASEAPTARLALAEDEECSTHGQESCALYALQRRGAKVQSHEPVAAKEEAPQSAPEFAHAEPQLVAEHPGGEGAALLGTEAKLGGVCTGGSMCTSYTSNSLCGNSIFGCHWSASCPGICTGGSMCQYSSQADCVNSIFSCSWQCQYYGAGSNGVCTGGSMCNYNSQSHCVNSIFGCSWKSSGWAGGGTAYGGSVYGGSGGGSAYGGTAYGGSGGGSAYAATTYP